MAKVKWPKLPRYFVPLFNTANIYLARTRNEWVQAEKALGVDAGQLSFTLGRCRHYQNESTGENMYLIGVFDNNIATLVHECAHATFYCCHDVGVVVETDKANETYCYLLDRMFSHFLPYIKEE
nr:MAG TPA: SprT-like family protein [Caudoviricetes sp.]